MKPEQITAWALDEASAEERQQLEAALLENPQHKQTAEETKAFCDFLLSELRDDSLALTETQREKLKAQPVVPSFRGPAAGAKPAPQTRWRIGIFVRLAVAACVALGGFWTWQSYLEKQTEGHAPVAVVAVEKPDIKVQLAQKPDAKKKAGVGADTRLLAATPVKAIVVEPQVVKPLAPGPMPVPVTAASALALSKEQKVMSAGDVEKLKRIQDQDAYALNFGDNKKTDPMARTSGVVTVDTSLASQVTGFDGFVNLGSPVVSPPASAGQGSLTFGGTIAGFGNLMQQGTGQGPLTGSNTFAGASQSVDPTKGATITAKSGTVSTVSLGNNTLVVGQTITGTALPVNNGATLNVTNANSFSNTFTGGVTINSGVVTQAGSTAPNSGTITIPVSPMAGAAAASSKSDITLAAEFKNPKTLAKAGAGTVTLTGANTYTGDTTISGGTLNVASAPEPRHPLADGERNKRVISDDGPAGATLDMNALKSADAFQRRSLSPTLSEEFEPASSARLGYSFIRNMGALANGGGANSLSGPPGGYGMNDIQQLTLGVNTNLGPVNLASSASYDLNGYVAAATAEPEFALKGSGELGWSVPGAAIPAASSTLNFNGGTTMTAGGAVALTNGAVNTVSATPALAGGGMTTSTGSTTAPTGNITSAGHLTKTGAGTVTLTGASTYTGATVINGGTLTTPAKGARNPDMPWALTDNGANPGATFDLSGAVVSNSGATAPSPSRQGVLGGWAATAPAAAPAGMAAQPARATHDSTANATVSMGGGTVSIGGAVSTTPPVKSEVVQVNATSATPPVALIVNPEPDARYFTGDMIASIATKDMPQYQATTAFRKADASGESYTHIIENELKDVAREPLSTLSIDVDTASYANVRRFLNQNVIPPPDAVRIEELVNYFPTAEEGPAHDAKEPFGVRIELAPCPWQPVHRLARIAIKGREMDKDRKASNLVFLVDVSGSMNEPAKLPLVQQSLRMLTEQLGEGDRVTMVVYAGSSGVVLPPTNGEKKAEILAAIDRLSAGGSTHGSAGIKLAYEQAVAGFIKGGVNRVILCTDGDFNVGVSSPEELEKLIKHKAKTGVFLSVLGFGSGNLKDRTMETLADKGNGNYAYIDSLSEARKVLVEQMSGTLDTIAKDVKIQVEFNPAAVRSYRLIGYENRLLAKEDFNDDTKDAGEIGAGHSVVALYEIVPANLPPGAEPRPAVDPLKYQAPAISPAQLVEAAKSGEMMTVKLRYKEPDSDLSKLIEVPTKDPGKTLTASSDEFKFSAAVAGFGLLLRDSSYKGSLSWETVRRLALDGKGTDKLGYRGEFLQLIDKARGLKETKQ